MKRVKRGMGKILTSLKRLDERGHLHLNVDLGCFTEQVGLGVWRRLRLDVRVHELAPLLRRLGELLDAY